MASGIRDFNVTLGSNIIMMVMSIGTQSCLAWFLGTAGRGSYAVCLMFATVLNIFFVVGCDIASIYFVSARRFSISEGVLYAFIYGGIGSVFGMAAGLILMQFPLSIFDKATPTMFYMALLLVPISVLSYTLMRLLTAVHQFVWFAVVSVANVVAQLLFTVVYVWGFSLGVHGALLGVISAGCVTIALTLVFFRWKYNIKWVKPKIKNLLEMFHYGARYYIGKISNQMNFQIGTIILAFFATKEEVGIFAVASQIAVRTMIIPNTLITVLIPKVAGDEGGKKELVAQCSRLTGLVSGIMLLLLGVFARPIITILFSSDFEGAVLLFRILAVGTLVRSVCKVFVPYLLGTNHPGISSLSVAVGAVVNMIALLLLLPLLGLSGAALAMVAGWLVGSILLMVGFLHHSELRLSQVWMFQSSDLAIVRQVFRGVIRKIPGSNG